MVLVIGAVLAGAGVYGYGHLAGSSTGTANEWVNPTSGISPSRCATACELNSTTAYGSIEQAYLAAQNGDTIRVSCGGASTAYYGPQVIDTNNASLTVAVTVETDPDCTPYVGGYAELTSTYSPGDATINVDNTLGFNPANAASFSVIIGGTFSGPSCTGKTATSFTGCTGVPNGSQSCGPVCTTWIAGADVVPSNNAVTISSVKFLTFDGLDANSFNVAGDAQNIVVKNATTHGASVSTSDLANNITYQHVTVGPKRGGHEPTLIQTGDAGNNTNVVFDDVTWTEDNSNACSSTDNQLCHQQAIFMRYARGVTIKNSRFFKCEQYCIFDTFSSTVGRAGQFMAEDVLIQNTFFGPQSCKLVNGDASQGISFPCAIGGNYLIHLRVDDSGLNRQLHNWTMEYNTIDGGTFLGNTNVTGGMVMRANYTNGSLFSCASSFTYRYNVQTGAACTGTGNVGGATFSVVNRLSNDLHLPNTSTAANQAGDPLSCPAVDIDGTTRPTGCDAGADQVSTGLATTGASTATCSPSPCTNGSTPSDSVNAISLGSINNGAGVETRRFAWYMPNNISGSPAVIFTAAGASCGSTEIPIEAFGNSGFQSVANANAFMVIALAKPTPCVVAPTTRPGGANATSWYHTNVDCGGSPSVCGLGSTPSDVPYVLAVKNYVCSHTFGGITPDCTRLYLHGLSSGGGLVRSVECDSSTSSLFRGYSIVSNGAHATTTGTTGVCPAGNTSLFNQIICSTGDTACPYNTLTFSDHRIMGFDAYRAWWQTYQGCSTATSTVVESGVTKYDYQCSFGTSPAFQAISVTGTGHGNAGIDGTPGNRGASWTAGKIWAFFAGTTG